MQDLARQLYEPMPSFAGLESGKSYELLSKLPEWGTI